MTSEVLVRNFVDITEYELLVEPRYHKMGWTNEPRILGRLSAVMALKEAEACLPRGLRFKVWDFQRPLSVQLAMIDSFCERVAAAHPDWDTERVMEEVSKFAARPLPDAQVTRPDCHRNGGAVDPTVVDAEGTELNMGTDHDDLTDRAASMYFERDGLTAEEEVIRDNRRILRYAMESAGWEMLPSEWWHWSTSR